MGAMQCNQCYQDSSPKICDSLMLAARKQPLRGAANPNPKKGLAAQPTIPFDPLGFTADIFCTFAHGRQSHSQKLAD
jgi:hypothetical protein